MVIFFLSACFLKHWEQSNNVIAPSKWRIFCHVGRWTLLSHSVQSIRCSDIFTRNTTHSQDLREKAPPDTARILNSGQLTWRRPDWPTDRSSVSCTGHGQCAHAVWVRSSPLRLDRRRLRRSRYRPTKELCDAVDFWLTPTTFSFQSIIILTGRKPLVCFKNQLQDRTVWYKVHQTVVGRRQQNRRNVVITISLLLFYYMQYAF